MLPLQIRQRLNHKSAALLKLFVHAQSSLAVKLKKGFNQKHKCLPDVYIHVYTKKRLTHTSKRLNERGETSPASEAFGDLLSLVEMRRKFDKFESSVTRRSSFESRKRRFSELSRRAL